MLCHVVVYCIVLPAVWLTGVMPLSFLLDHDKLGGSREPTIAEKLEVASRI